MTHVHRTLHLFSITLTASSRVVWSDNMVRGRPPRYRLKYRSRDVIYMVSGHVINVYYVTRHYYVNSAPYGVCYADAERLSSEESGDIREADNKVCDRYLPYIGIALYTSLYGHSYMYI